MPANAADIRVFKRGTENAWLATTNTKILANQHPTKVIFAHLEGPCYNSAPIRYQTVGIAVKTISFSTSSQTIAILPHRVRWRIPRHAPGWTWT